jgi:branched-chain amino acid transport system ATP-binding protein
VPPQGFRALVREASNWKAVRKSPYGLAPVIILAATGFFLRLSETIFGLAAPDIIRELHITIAGITQYSAFVGTVAIGGTIGLAYLADRGPRVKMYGYGLIVGGAINTLVARGTTALGIGVPNVASDMAVMVANTPSTSLLADYYPLHVRGKVIALSSVLGTGGALVTPLVVAAAISRFGWRAAYVIFSVPICIMGVVALVKLREPVRGFMERQAMGVTDQAALQEEQRSSFGEAWRTVWAIRTLRRTFLASIWTGGAGSIISLLTGLILVQEYGLSVNERALISTVTAVVLLPASFLSGGVVDFLTKWRPSQVLSLAGALGVVASLPILLYALTPPLWILIGSGLVFGVLSSLIAPILSVVSLQILPAHVRTMGGAVMSLALLPGLVVFTPMAGQIAQNYDLTTGMLFAFPVLVIGACIAWSAAPLFEFDMRAAVAANMASEEWRRAKEEGRDKLLVCRDVDVAYDGVQVIFGVDFDVAEGDIIALLGTNGAGKSTLLRAISGSQEAASGAIIFDGRDITHMPPHEIAARGVIHMPGGRGVFPGLTVRENLLMGNWLANPLEAEQRLPEVLEMFPVLARQADLPAGQLSGGEQQMLSLAQAFLARPRLLMIDELSLGLAPAVVGELLDVVRRIHEQGATIIIVEQSVNVALAIAERAIFMEKGEVRFVGSTADLIARPDVLRAVYVKGTTGTVAATGRSGPLLESAAPILEVEGIVKSYGGVRAVDGVSFTLRNGETLGVVGPNGSGKTTLFDIISGYVPPDSGTIGFEGVDITLLPPEERARRKLVRRFQDGRLFPSLTVFETLLVAFDQRLEVRNVLVTAMAGPSARRSERRARARATALIEILGLGSYRDKFVKELSTGVRRIVDLACVLATEPKVLLLDEPSSGIAQAEAENLGPLLRRVVNETGCSLLLIEHDMPLIASVSDELLAMDQGRVLTRGLPRDVLDDDRVAAAYLGDSKAAIERSGAIT